MNCKKCGSKNVDGNKFCAQCGAPLGGGRLGEAYDPDWDAMRDEDMPTVEDSSYFNELEEKFSDGVDDWDYVKNSGYSKAGRRDGGKDAYYEPVEKRARRSGGGKGSAINKLLVILMLALLAVIIVVVALTLKGGLGSGGAESSASEVKLNPNNPDRYFVTVLAQEGTTVVFEGTDGSKKDLQASSKQKVTFNVHRNSLLPQEYLETETVTVKPTVYQLDADNNRTDIDVPEIELKVPAVTVDFATEDSFDSADGAITIKGTLRTANAELMINGESVGVDENGNFAYTVKRDKGEHRFEFVARLLAHRTLKKNFVANVTQVLNAEQVIVIRDDMPARSLNVETSIKVYGAVPAGSTISISSNDPDFTLKSEPEVDESGNFGFEVNLPIAAKSYKFVITATLQDGAVFERPFSVERPPIYNDYVPTVWSGTYEEMVKPVHVTDQRGFLIKGTVDEIIYDGDYLVAKFTLEGGKLIEIEYHDHYSTASKLEVGSNYTMYGFSLGTSVSPDGNLRLFIWFVQD